MTIVRALIGDLTTQDVDAIVNAAKPQLSGGGGVDGAIHLAAGPSVLAECRAWVADHGNLPPGEAMITGGGDLIARHVIHTVGPVFDEAHAAEHDRTLASAYRNSLQLAADRGLRSVAFPNISCGVYRFPLERAARVARGAVEAWIAANPDALDEVRFVCFNQPTFARYEDLTRFATGFGPQGGQNR
ncbi:MAG: macro domain-containing protein [Actinobacteria bacterium]|nr:macro domain-containing protein [Actinomycetota bacterium]